MPIANRIENYFFGRSLRLSIGSSFCGVWFHWPILCYHIAAPRNRGVQTTERTNVDEGGHMVPKHTIHNILRAADGATFMVVNASLHGRTQVVYNLRSRNGAVDGCGISQIPEKNFDVAIVHELRRRLPPNEDANTVALLQQPSHQMTPD
jgi:hypothetical protein